MQAQYLECPLSLFLSGTASCLLLPLLRLRQQNPRCTHTHNLCLPALGEVTSNTALRRRSDTDPKPNQPRSALLAPPRIASGSQHPRISLVSEIYCPERLYPAVLWLSSSCLQTPLSAQSSSSARQNDQFLHLDATNQRLRSSTTPLPPTLHLSFGQGHLLHPLHRRFDSSIALHSRQPTLRLFAVCQHRLLHLPPNPLTDCTVTPLSLASRHTVR